MQLPEDLESLCNEVCSVSREVGKFILLEQKRLTGNSIESKGLNDFVTYVDKASETLLVSELSSLFPEAGFITEEKTIAQEDKPYRWVIDPIDGTTNFIHGLPMFCISIALMHDERVILGVVYEISHDECFHAVAGGNAYLNGKPIRVSDRSLLKDSLIVTGFPYKDEGRLEEWMRLFMHLLTKSHGVRRLGSAALDLAYVACGRFEAFYEYGLSPWDVAAGTLIVQQAGGAVSDYSGGNKYLFGKELLAGNGRMNEELREVIQQQFSNRNA
jgi:myo-inositol-1(or 4)-monophosphatase